MNVINVIFVFILMIYMTNIIVFLINVYQQMRMTILKNFQETILKYGRNFNKIFEIHFCQNYYLGVNYFKEN